MEGAAVKLELEKIVSSTTFSKSPRMRRFLGFIVEEALVGRGASLKEAIIGVAVFDKQPSYDPQADPTVRVEASKLRSKLVRYYAAEGRSDPLRIEIPKGGYSPVFTACASAEARAEEPPGARKPVTRTSWTKPLLAAGITAALALLGAALVTVWVRPPSRGEAVIRFLLYPPAGVEIGDLRTAGPAVVSPDGHYVAFVGISRGRRARIWLRPLDSVSAHPLEDTEGATYPFWAPDSNHLAFFAKGKLKRIGIRGGVATTLCEAPLGRGGAWSSNGTIIFAPNAQGPLYSFDTMAGRAAPLTGLHEITADHSKWDRPRNPYFLPDGRRFLYAAIGTMSEIPGVFQTALRGNNHGQASELLLESDSGAAFVPSKWKKRAGYLLYVRADSLIAQPVTGRLQQAGDPIEIGKGVRTGFERQVGDFSASLNGVLIYRSLPPARKRTVRFDRGGRRLDEIAGSGTDRDVALSPDGTRLATVRFRGDSLTSDIWVCNINGRAESRFTSNGGTHYTPVWSPDGRTLFFVSQESNGFGIYRHGVLEAGEAQHLLSVSRFVALNDYWRDRTRLLYQERNDRGDYDLWSLDLSGKPRASPLLKTPFNETQARVSPDSRWLAYTSDESGRPEIYIQSLNAREARRVQVSKGGGVQPQWRADGRELFYVSLDGTLMAAAIRPSALPDIGVPLMQFGSQIASAGVDAMEQYAYSAASDGSHFLAVIGDKEEHLAPWTVILNWTNDFDR